MQVRELLRYKFFLFDCDGVVLDSNKIKSNGFMELFKDFAPEKINDFIRYHKKNNGISRFEKIKFFYNHYLNVKLKKKELDNLSQRYSQIIFERLLNADLVNGIIKFLEVLNNNEKELFVISGSFEEELKIILKKKKISKFFKQICGSPKTKYENFELLKKKYSIKNNESIYIGDSKIDYELSNFYNLRFLHIYKHTDAYFDNTNSYKVINDFEDLIYE